MSFRLHNFGFQYKLPSIPVAPTLLKKAEATLADDPAMRHRIHFALILLLVGSVTLTARAATVFKSIAWTPQELQTGSACLFAVQLEGSPAKLSGTWMGHDVSFFRSHDGRVWYGLAGVDVEALPGTYPLDVAATMPDGEVIHLARDVQVGPSNYKTVTLRVPERFVKPDAATLRRIESDKQAKSIAFSHQIPTPEWSGDFLAPAGSVVTDSFGTRRVFNGQLASIHRGMDFRVKIRIAGVGSEFRRSGAGSRNVLRRQLRDHRSR